MSSQEIEASIDEMRGHVERLLDTLDNRMDEPRLDELVENGGTIDRSNIRQSPERCVEDALIWPMLETLGFKYTPRPYYEKVERKGAESGEIPDFSIDNLSEMVIGENKSLNRFEPAKLDIEDYLHTPNHEYGIATDGFRWAMYTLVTGDGETERKEVIGEQNLTPAVQHIARERGLVSYTRELDAVEEDGRTADAVLGRFYQTFNHYAVRRAIGGLTEFYDLYLEVISGDGEYQTLESNLCDGLDAPVGSSRGDRLAFALLLADRMAFLKLLINRGVIDNVAFHEQWDEHTNGLNQFQGSFYSQYLQPLFYDAFATPPRRRDEDLPGAFRDVPYLAGGLFERILPDERDYDVPDTAIKPVLSRFIEGEGRTLINEAADSSLLQTYTEDFESRDLAGELPQHYSDIVDAYEDEIEYVESDVERTLRSYTRAETN